ncbi:hypothetical protein JD844_003876 [Phrynosoma platyrhinos]|uniref:Uncharacterized protein n=1 Tax=Phrynosoma platyrhinos TaxID=52577 RepID=A0ABQ7TDA7_PHRPL|nr:hypothetical protein JD844_003876 [Phrynosoma platyrhinos]
MTLLPHPQIRELVPESQAYMDLLAFERKLDQTIMRKRVDIQEALKRPMKQKRKLRLYISNTFNPAKSDADDSDGSIASWELRVEGKLLDDVRTHVRMWACTCTHLCTDSHLSKQKRKFSSFFKSLVIELDKDLYGPDNHLVEWHRTPTTQETDGFQVKRPGDVSVRCTLLLMLDYQVGPPMLRGSSEVMTDVVGNPEEERRAAFYHEPWSQEAVSRYFYCKIQQRRQELEQSLGVRNT